MSEDPAVKAPVFDASKIDPAEQHSLREWSNKIGLGEANIRTAIRKGTLKGQMVTKKNDDGTESTTRRWEMTGQQILDWRAQKNVRNGTGAPKVKGATSYRVKLTVEQQPIVQAFLDEKFPGTLLTLPKPKAAADAVASEAVIEAPVARNIAEPAAPKKSLFGSK